MVHYEVAYVSVERRKRKFYGHFVVNYTGLLSANAPKAKYVGNGLVMVIGHC